MGWVLISYKEFQIHTFQTNNLWLRHEILLNHSMASMKRLRDNSWIFKMFFLVIDITFLINCDVNIAFSHLDGEDVSQGKRNYFVHVTQVMAIVWFILITIWEFIVIFLFNLIVYLDVFSKALYFVHVWLLQERKIYVVFESGITDCQLYCNDLPRENFQITKSSHAMCWVIYMSLVILFLKWWVNSN